MISSHSFPVNVMKTTQRHSEEFVLRYCCPSKKQFHVARFNVGKELDFPSLPQPIHMYREGSGDSAYLPRKETVINI
jgi:hypothetical protein